MTNPPLTAHSPSPALPPLLHADAPASFSGCAVTQIFTVRNPATHDSEMSLRNISPRAYHTYKHLSPTSTLGRGHAGRQWAPHGHSGLHPCHPLVMDAAECVRGSGNTGGLGVGGSVTDLTTVVPTTKILRVSSILVPALVTMIQCHHLHNCFHAQSCFTPL